jgi:hypothetical protein
MKFDTAVKELQKEKADLEARLKQVNVAIAALAKLGGKESMTSPLQKPATSTSAAQSATVTKPVPAAPSPTNKPLGS